ncbi:MAG: hypothetical protein JXB48_21310 [Candidatus Latescibacteria bacterium]|nr:hypothetical protein [Candidatus Latescibacterota bacterium]
MNLSARNQKLLAVIQSDFPITTRPFVSVGNSIDWTEDEVIESIDSLKKNGLIREFGPVFDAGNIGYVSTLIAVKIDTNHIEELVQVMLDIREITHCYLRNHEFNLWFTITALNKTIINIIIDRVKLFSGVSVVLNLPAMKVYKINAVFDAEHAKCRNIGKSYIDINLSDSDKDLIRELQKGFPIVKNPFELIANRTKLHESAIIDTISDWIETGIIRRFGARLNHKNAGFSSNCMAVWKDEHIDMLGITFSKMRQVSHCYRRISCDDWPYGLYTMLHAKSDNELIELLHSMKTAAPNAEMLALKTEKELKKTSMIYFMEDETWDSR